LNEKLSMDEAIAGSGDGTRGLIIKNLGDTRLECKNVS